MLPSGAEKHFVFHGSFAGFLFFSSNFFIYF